MKAKIKGKKVDLKNWKTIKKIHSTAYTKEGVKVEHEIQIFYPDVMGVIQRKTFTYEKERDMMIDYQKLVIKVLLK
jgi:hypothetical protein